ncbi:DUF721 domain-containing protein [Arcanobacterium haemolyticum]|uniref:DUF721 domain-containing protein n=1 Tax=Arcanobacterium haemolyticum (strain ATCC 9345 / DSM 20595 / CCM 5947 / CCUG 17215 / LMG 16163 / NBRC 15585 / NCTC 8452 / 11018) TaxID=644284 RepID=D7BLH3_ARCHD|nr:DciA family protein [Arcanobacterium haemolyticum]ADH91772.1 protein of unknown function DUF721 [Arcanobacterium haemolyticum DSM 20595]SQH27440.1 Zn-ribbon-containing, possibly RNA-binding protein and truncated derivatives [Arcanobacterium haemolyticum]
MSRIEVAKREAAHKHGDVLPLQILERVRRMAADQGFVRRRSVSRETLAATKPTPIGDAPLVPSPGQEVGSGARPSYRDPKPVFELMKKAIEERGWKSQLDVASVAARWPEIVGESVAANCAVVEFTPDGTLTLKARTVAWETQMRSLLHHLDARLAQELGEGVVKEIVLNGPYVPSWKHGKLSVPGRGPRDTYS